MASSCITSENGQICDMINEYQNNENDNQPVSYEARKKQASGENDPYIEKDGIDYNGSGEFFADIFDETRLPVDIHTKTGIENVKRSFLYVISKKVDDRTFIKIGISKNYNNSSTRLGELQTSLIPGLENIGFKVHYLFFYPYESKEKVSTFAELIEKELHKVLQNHKKYNKMVIHFPTAKASEWYLPDSNKYKDFINFVLAFISVQTPYPEEGYHFFLGRGKKFKREYMYKFMKNIKQKDVIQFRKDFIKAKQEILFQRKLSKNENLSKFGSLQYFKKKLITNVIQSNPPLGKDLKISDVYYHKKQSDGIRIFGNYYFRIIPRTPRDIKKILIDYTTETSDDVQYWTHIYNILSVMNENKNLDAYGLTSNYNHYFSDPLEKGKKILMQAGSNNIELRQNKVNWVIGRYMRDKSDGLYVATKLNLSRKGQTVNTISVQEVNESTMIPFGDEIRANPLVVLQLVIDYQYSKASKYNISDEYESTIRQEGSTKYKNYDIVQFRPNYFRNMNTNEPIDESYMAIILNNYFRFDTGAKKYLRYYDVLFESELWRLEVKEVDNTNNAKLVTNENEQKEFVKNIKYKRNVISHVIRRLGVAQESRMSASSEQTRKKKKTTSVQTTRRSVRNIKYNLRTRKNVRLYI